jgi:hypothetical protein
MDNESEGEPIELSEGEEKLVQQIRQWANESGTRPMVATVLYTNGIWQIWQGVPRGTLKAE